MNKGKTKGSDSFPILEWISGRLHLHQLSISPVILDSQQEPCVTSKSILLRFGDKWPDIALKIAQNYNLTLNVACACGRKTSNYGPLTNICGQHSFLLIRKCLLSNVVQWENMTGQNKWLWAILRRFITGSFNYFPCKQFIEYWPDPHCCYLSLFPYRLNTQPLPSSINWHHPGSAFPSIACQNKCRQLLASPNILANTTISVIINHL